MGDAGVFSNEQLLILSGTTWPDSWLDKIRRRFPGMEITVFLRDTSKPLEETVPKSESIPSAQRS